MNPDDVVMHLAISQVLARYCHAVDQGDLEMARSVYWPDAVDRHGPHWDGAAHGYMDAMHARWSELLGSGASATGFLHHLGGIVIRRAGPDEARVQAYFTAFVPTGGDGRTTLLSGRFLDRFRCRDGEWRVLERTVVMDRSFDLGVDGGPPSGFPGGGYGPADPGAAFLAAADTLAGSRT